MEYKYIIIGVYLICGLLHIWGTIQQGIHSGGAVLPSELVTSFLFWPIIIMCQIAINIAFAMVMPENDEGDDDNDIS